MTTLVQVLDRVIFREIMHESESYRANLRHKTAVNDFEPGFQSDSARVVPIESSWIKAD